MLFGKETNGLVKGAVSFILRVGVRVYIVPTFTVGLSILLDLTLIMLKLFAMAAINIWAVIRKSIESIKLLS
jgi:hypothetical protein